MSVDYFASDFHLAEDRPDITERFLRFLDMVAENADRLFLLGDIFDLWVGPKQARLSYVGPVIERLMALDSSGMELVFVPGNRDFNFGPWDGRRADRTAPSDLTVTSGGRRLYLAHGDLLCTADHSYRRARRTMRSAPIRSIFNNMPLPISMFLSRGYRRLSMRAVARKPRREKAVNFAAVRAHLLAGHDTVVCGHVHRAARYEVELPGGRQGEFITLGDWERGGSYLVGENDRLLLRKFP
ncbi:MAG: UDP-2,3-diacylglucosamine diphosphatase [Planctomycetota bacterium]